MKRKKGLLVFAILSIGSLFGFIARAGQSFTSTIVFFQPPNYNVDCVWFTLAGVTQADPILPNSPWFAIPRTQIGYNEVYAAILAAKLSGTSLNVVTTGSAAGGACGAYAGIASVMMQ